MKESDGRSFNERREKCGQFTRDVLDFLETVAEHAGAQVEPPTFDGTEWVLHTVEQENGSVGSIRSIKRTMRDTISILATSRHPL